MSARCMWNWYTGADIPYHYPPATREDWRRHWRLFGRVMLVGVAVWPVGFIVGLVIGTLV